MHLFFKKLAWLFLLLPALRATSPNEGRLS